MVSLFARWRLVLRSRESGRCSKVAAVLGKSHVLRFGPVFLLLAFGSCRPAAGPPPPADARLTDPPLSQRPEPPQTASFVRTLSGEWRVAGVDGRSLDEPVGLALRANEEEIWWEPRCAGMARRYRINGQQISFQSAGPPRAPGALTPPVCAIGLPPKLQLVFQAIDGAETISRTPGNGISISGPRHSVVLYSQ